MEIYRSMRDVPRSSGRVAAIGFFDGVHIGHQRLIRAMLASSKQEGKDHLVMTFEPHPLEVVLPRCSVKYLTTFDKKAEILAEMGVSALLVLPFTPEFSAMAPAKFAAEVLRENLNCKDVFVGYNFTFGVKGTGTASLLGKLGLDLGFSVHVIEPVTLDGVVVSSTFTRSLVLKGRVDKAAKMLGRFYSIRGRVIRGESRGKELGFPTANLDVPPQQALPRQGVYAVTVRVDGASYDASYDGVANVGCKPTFGGHSVNVEVHLLEVSCNLYERIIEVSFVKRLRDEVRFSSRSELVKQISSDCLQARNLLRDSMNGAVLETLDQL